MPWLVKKEYYYSLSKLLNILTWLTYRRKLSMVPTNPLNTKHPEIKLLPRAQLCNKDIIVHWPYVKHFELQHTGKMRSHPLNLSLAHTYAYKTNHRLCLVDTHAHTHAYKTSHHLCLVANGNPLEVVSSDCNTQTCTCMLKVHWKKTTSSHLPLL